VGTPSDQKTAQTVPKTNQITLRTQSKTGSWKPHPRLKLVPFAADWYWENEKKLSAPQRNQVAKIYMERAIELQDIEAAKGWLKFINEGDRASFISRLNESKR